MNKPTNNSDPQKQALAKRSRFSFRINVFFFCTFFIFSILIVKLAILQFVEVKDLLKEEDQITIQGTPIAPIRGNIYDLTGYPIAESDSTQSLFYHYDTGKSKDEVVQLAYRLSLIFQQYGDQSLRHLTPSHVIKAMDVGFDIDKMQTTPPGYSFTPRRIKAGLSNAEVAYILEHHDQFHGIEIIEESVRNYDDKKIAVQLVGYLRSYSTATEKRWGLDFYKEIEMQNDLSVNYLATEVVGFDGIELMYQKELRGQNGSKSYPVNAAQQIIGPATITPPVKGNNLYLTIHKDVQLATEQAILDQLAYMKTDEARRLKYPAMGSKATTGYAVAMEVKTGKVVAMASMPDYDPDIFRGGSISQTDWDENEYFLKNGTISEAYPKYEDNTERAKHPTSLVPLGSTMKPLTILLGLNEKLITMNESYYDSGTYYFGRGKEVSLSNSQKHAYGSLTAETALSNSSNTYMSEMIGNRLYMRNGAAGVDIWDDYMKKFGLGVTTGSGLPGEISGTRNYLHEVKSGSAQSALIYASFGQQGRYTALQLAQFVTTLANRGKRPRPLFVDRITTFDGQLVRKVEPEFLNEEEYPDAYWDLIERAMQRVKQQGFDGFPHKFASKTGTSEQDVAGGRVENAVFIAYAPADNPQLAVAVVIPEGGYGGWGAAPIARHIFDAYDKHIGLLGKPNPQAGITKSVDIE